MESTLTNAGTPEENNNLSAETNATTTSSENSSVETSEEISSTEITPITNEVNSQESLPKIEDAPIPSVEAVTEEHHEAAVEVPTVELVIEEHHDPVIHEEEVHLAQMEVGEEDNEVEPLEDFGILNKEQLTEKMKAFSVVADVNTVKNRVQAAKDAFQIIVNHERDVAFAAFTEQGGIKEEFDYKDSLEAPFFDAYKEFHKRRSEFVLGQEKIRQGNLKLKTEILSQMKNILQKEEDMSKAFNEFHELQAKWRAVGPIPPQNMNDLWMTYKLYSDRFFEFIKLNRELQDLEMKKNLEMKIHLCEKAEEQLLEPSLNKALQEIQTLQNKWREIGGVPREKRTEIWQRFKAVVDKVYENKRGYLDGMKQQFDANLAAKTALCEKAEAILKEEFSKHNQWQDSLKALLELQTDWRKIGPTGKDTNDTIWQRFKTTCDLFFKNKDNFYKNKKQEYATNLAAKTELCAQAEAFKESTDWKNSANELIRLQQEWKKIGPAGDKNEKIWQRFKAACDAFFNRKSEHFADQDQEQGGNLEKKNELITQVEAYVAPSDANEALEQLKAFQRQFMDIGLVPLKQKDTIQQRFRAAIQVHFDALKSNPEYKQSYRPRTEKSDRPQRNDRNDRVDRSHSQSGGNDEQRNLQSKVTALNSEVQLWENNLGFFANSKNANALREEYEQKIQSAKDEINKLKAKLAELRNA
jgi:hypothetical protein